MAKIKFGYKDIDESEKPSQVNTVFTSVSNKYDVMNDYVFWASSVLEKAIRKIM